VKGLRRALLDWYRANRRDLPWRATRDPYAIWISEAMLQQTRVETAIPYYERFLTRFPDVQTLADSDPDEVLGVWAGLGYYSRARNLHAAARVIVDEHAGELPDDAEALRSLPGVGRYTAGAVASIAFDRPEPVVDGNVSRVFARLRGIRDDLRKAATVRRLWEEAAALVPGPHPGDLNQALMELGARVCTPRAPRCPVCPVAHHCEAHRGGDAEALPVHSKPAEPRRVEAVAALVLRRGRALAVRRPSGLLAGLWELPGGELSRGERPAAGLKRALRERVGLTVARVQRAGALEHAFSHRLLHLVVYRCDTPQGRLRLRGFDGHRWLAPKSFARLPQGTVTRKALDLVLERTPSGASTTGSR
jgi:A/G-specific adenine glycosylase